MHGLYVLWKTEKFVLASILETTTDLAELLSTLAMKSWTIEKVLSEFTVSKHTVNQAQELQQECCILSPVPVARGKL